MKFKTILTIGVLLLSIFYFSFFNGSYTEPKEIKEEKVKTSTSSFVINDSMVAKETKTPISKEKPVILEIEKGKGSIVTVITVDPNGNNKIAGIEILLEKKVEAEEITLHNEDKFFSSRNESRIIWIPEKETTGKFVLASSKTTITIKKIIVVDKNGNILNVN